MFDWVPGARHLGTGLLLDGRERTSSLQLIRLEIIQFSSIEICVFIPMNLWFIWNILIAIVSPSVALILVDLCFCIPILYYNKYWFNALPKMYDKKNVVEETTVDENSQDYKEYKLFVWFFSTVSWVFGVIGVAFSFVLAILYKFGIMIN